MLKKLIATKLSPNDHSKFFSFYQGDLIMKEKHFLKAFSQFKQKYGKSKDYKLKYAEFERVYSVGFQITLPEDIVNQIEQLASKFEVSRSAFVREIICEYLVAQKK